ncbi:MAG: histone [Candidatus Aenigmatarchaeota archaeon]
MIDDSKVQKKSTEKFTITLEPLRRLMLDAGAERISDDAIKELSRYLEKKTIELIKEGKKISQHSGRATISKDDIRLARRVVFRE